MKWRPAKVGVSFSFSCAFAAHLIRVVCPCLATRFKHKRSITRRKKPQGKIRSPSERAAGGLGVKSGCQGLIMLLPCEYIWM